MAAPEQVRKVQLDGVCTIPCAKCGRHLEQVYVIELTENFRTQNNTLLKAGSVHVFGPDCKDKVQGILLEHYVAVEPVVEGGVQ